MDDYEDVKKVTEDLDRLLKASSKDFYYIKGYIHCALNKENGEVTKDSRTENRSNGF